MIGRIIKVLFAFLLASVLLIVIFRNSIIKFYIENYAGKNIKAVCKVAEVNLWFDNISFKDLAVKSAGYEISGKDIKINFKLRKQKPFFYISGAAISDVSVWVKLPDNPSKISEKKPALAQADVFPEPVVLSLENVKISLKNKSLEINSNFSIIAKVARNLISIKDAAVTDLDVVSQDFEVTNLNLKRYRQDKYLIKIPSLRIKQKKFTDFFIPVKAGENQFLFPMAKNQLLGNDAFVSARCDFKSFDNFCFGAKFKGASFEGIVDAFAPEDAAFRGIFDGALKGCVIDFKMNGILADFTNKGKGFINIKKESSFAFLKSYLDEPSYNALIDNFRNYEYNIGTVTAKQEGNNLNVNLDFTSDTMGKRSIAINFHDIAGGLQ